VEKWRSGKVEKWKSGEVGPTFRSAQHLASVYRPDGLSPMILDGWGKPR
jgi:hypothetical protein